MDLVFVITNLETYWNGKSFTPNISEAITYKNLPSAKSVAKKVNGTVLLKDGDIFHAEPFYCTKKNLIEQGWTEGMIKKRLGQPDTEAKNPHYSSSEPVKLYLKARVDKIIEADEKLQQQLKERILKRKKDRGEISAHEYIFAMAD